MVGCFSREHRVGFAVYRVNTIARTMCTDPRPLEYPAVSIEINDLELFVDGSHGYESTFREMIVAPVGLDTPLRLPICRDACSAIPEIQCSCCTFTLGSLMVDDDLIGRVREPP